MAASTQPEKGKVFKVILQDRNSMNEVTLAYLAGLFDDEGSIRIAKRTTRKKPHHYPQVKITITNREIIEFIRDFFACGSIRIENRNPKWKTAYQWQVTDSKAIEVIKQLYPYLKLKKKKAEIVLKFWEIGKPRYKGKRRGIILDDETIKERERLYQLCKETG